MTKNIVKESKKIEEEFIILAEGGVNTPQGFYTAGLHCGIKKKRNDLGIIVSEVPAKAAAVYTTNQFPAAPLIVTKETLEKKQDIRALIVNSGNANAFTGEAGLRNAKEMQELTAANFQIGVDEVVVASTGVIGEQLPMEKIAAGIKELTNHLNKNNLDSFLEAIMTTDTMQKTVAVQTEIAGKLVTIGGAAKGSGMIHPNMATMLSFITTDVKIEQNELQELLKEVTNNTFNMITVDGDTSTNDMVLIMANGLAGNRILTKKEEDWGKFREALQYVATTLAKAIAKDGEGATKLITVNVQGAKDEAMAKKIAKLIVGSNLVKTAVFGADGNWGRIIMAIGNSGYPVRPEELTIAIGSITLIKNGIKQAYSEEEVTLALQQKEVEITVELRQGNYQATAWGCDLTYEYVRINGAYRT